MRIARLCWLLVLVVAPPAFAAAPPPGRRDLYGDPLPPGAVARLGSVRWRKFGGLQNPVLSPDGRWLVSTSSFGAGDDGLHVWEVATGRLVRTLNPRPEDDGTPLGTFAFMPDGKHFLSWDDRSLGLYLWAFPSGRLRWMAQGPKINVTAMAVSRDSRLAAAGNCYGKVFLYDLRSWKCVHSFPGDGKVHSLAFTTDGCLSVVEQGETLEHFRVRRIDLLTRRELRRFVVGPVDAGASQAHLSPDGQHVAAILKEGVCLWEIKSGMRRLVGSVRHRIVELSPDEQIKTLAFSADGSTLVALDYHYAWLCDVGSASLVNRIRCRDNPPLGFRAFFSLDGGMLGVSDDSEMTWRDVRTGRRMQHRPGFPSSAGALGYSRDGRSMVVVSWSEISRWDAGTGRRLDRTTVDLSHTIGLGPSPPRPVLTQGGDQVVSASGQSIAITDTHTAKTHLLSGHSADIKALALSANGRLLASADDREVRLWDFPVGKQRWRIDMSKVARIVRGLAFSRDGGKLAVGENRARLHLLDVATGKLLASLQSEGEKRVNALADFPDGEWAGIFSSNGEMLFTAHRDLFRIWDLKQRRPVLTEKSEPIRMPGAPITFPPGLGHGLSTPAALATSADGRFLGRIDTWGNLSLYEIASRRLLHAFPHASLPISFSPSGWRLAASNLEDSTILIWDLGTLFRSLPPPRPGVQTVSTLWADLAHRDAGLAHRALWRLAVLPGMEDFLDRQLRFLPADSLERHLADLGSDDFATRERAEQAIAKVGAAAWPALEAALAKTEDLELRTRLERLLRPLDLDGTGALRLHRAVLALEARGTPAARRVLGRLAAGIPGARLTEEAKRAMMRLHGRGAKG